MIKDTREARSQPQPRRRWRLRWDRVLPLVFCLAVWALIGWALGAVLWK